MFNPVCVCGHKEHWHNATGCEGLHNAGCSGCNGFEESEDSRSRNPSTTVIQVAEGTPCVCGHAADDHAVSDPSWKRAVCLTRFYIEPSGCGCEEYRPTMQLVRE